LTGFNTIYYNFLIMW